MEEILLKAKEKAMIEQFLINVATPEKLKEYFLEKYINPLEETISNINKDFFEIIQVSKPRTTIHFLNNSLNIVVHANRVKFTDIKDITIFEVDFHGEKPKVNQGNELVLLNDFHLKSIVDHLVSY